MSTPSTVVNPPNSPSLQELGFHTHDSLREACNANKNQKWILENVISVESVSIVVGDSGHGKTPLCYQLGLCVAAGKPFLGIPTTKGCVVYFDLENSEADSLRVQDDIKTHLRLEKVPETFLTHFGAEQQLEKILEKARPTLAIVDSLRAHNPKIEMDNTHAGEVLNGLRRLAKKYKCAIMFIHHIRKGDLKNPPAPLETAERLMTWLEQASGARALINQSDCRIGVDSVHVDAKNPNPITDEAAIVLRGHRRITGEFGPYYLAREIDESTGEPIGYRKLSGTDFVRLLIEHQQMAFYRLPLAFTFTEAKAIYGKESPATSKFLKKCLSLGLIARLSSGGYKKVVLSELPPAPAPYKPTPRTKLHEYVAGIPFDESFKIQDAIDAAGANRKHVLELLQELAADGMVRQGQRSTWKRVKSASEAFLSHTPSRKEAKSA